MRETIAGPVGKAQVRWWLELSFSRSGADWVASIDVLTLEGDEEPLRFVGRTQSEAAAKALRRMALELE